MEPLTYILAFSAAAGLLTLTPGIDTALVLRTAVVEGPRPALAAGAGVCLGVLTLGLATAAGLGAVLALSPAAYKVIQYVGAGYWAWLGFRLLLQAIRGGAATPDAQTKIDGRGGSAWFVRGLLTNLLNPKVGLFYVSFLPQFTPPGAPVVAFSALLATIHALMGLAWFAALVGATRPLAGLLRRPSFNRGVDGLTGAVMVALAARLLLHPSAR